MKAVILTEAETPLEIADVELEGPRHGQVRVQVKACGVCHSDISLVNGTFPLYGPTVPGHEAAGIVTELGPGVENLAVGDHVVLSPNPTCGRCRACRRGRYGMCEQAIGVVTFSFPDGTTGLSRGGELLYRGFGLGAWAEEVVVDERGAVRIPKEIPLDVACVIGCAVQTGVGAAVNTASILPGDSVLIAGAGGVGCSIAAGAAISGATHVIVSDPDESRREQAMRFGATHVIDPSGGDVVAAVNQIVEGGVDSAFDAVGAAAIVESCMTACCNGGETIVVGAAPLEDSVPVHLVSIMSTEKSIKGSLLGSCNGQRDIPRIVDMWQSGRLPLEEMVTARRPMSEVNEAVADARALKGLRTVLLMD
jgi:Zn-dependent alcohol dehydrogenase